MSTFWMDELEKFKAVKRKSAQVTSLIEFAERMAAKLTSTQNELDAVKAKHEEELTKLKTEIREVREELDIAWKNQD